MRSYKSNLSKNETSNTSLYKFQPFVFSKLVPRNSEPKPRSGHRIVCDEDNFYLYGGYNPLNAEVEGEEDVRSLFREVWQFNIASRNWKRLRVNDIPLALASNTLILSGKVLIVYGGTGVPFHLARSNDLSICSLSEPVLRFKRIKVTGETPQRLYGQAVFMKNEYLYTIGGTTGYEYLIDIHRLNLNTNRWEVVYVSKGELNEPEGRYRHEIAVVEDKVYVLGGGIGTEAFPVDILPIFDLKERKWDLISTLRDEKNGFPMPRQYHSVVNIPDTKSFILVGGVLEGKILDDAWRLDIPSLKWTRINSLRLVTPVYFHSSSVTPSGQLFIFGGVSQNSDVNRDSDDVHVRVSQIQSAWLCIPKLKDIVWEAVIHYGFIKESTSEHFATLGLPQGYLTKFEKTNFNKWMNV